MPPLLVPLAFTVLRRVQETISGKALYEAKQLIIAALFVLVLVQPQVGVRFANPFLFTGVTRILLDMIAVSISPVLD